MARTRFFSLIILISKLRILFEANCTVQSFKSYTKLDSIGNDDFFCRFEYNSAIGTFTPDRIAAYCNLLVSQILRFASVRCEGCTDWFHPTCIEMTAEEAKRFDHFFCQNCFDDDSKMLHDLHHSHSASRHSDAKVPSNLYRNDCRRS